MNISIIRHGSTKGNQECRYVGTTDEILSREGIKFLREMKKEGCYILGAKVVVSPMKRCIQTVETIYADVEYEICTDLKECDFGEFEYKTYLELQHHKYYQEWIDSGGTLPFPGGEVPAEFKQRCIKEFLQIVSRYELCGKELAIIAHGGTVMAIMEALCVPKRDYYSWHVKNGEGYYCCYSHQSNRLECIREIKSLHKGKFI